MNINSLVQQAYQREQAKQNIEEYKRIYYGECKNLAHGVLSSKCTEALSNFMLKAGALHDQINVLDILHPQNAKAYLDSLSKNDINVSPLEPTDSNSYLIPIIIAGSLVVLTIAYFCKSKPTRTQKMAALTKKITQKPAENNPSVPAEPKKKSTKKSDAEERTKRRVIEEAETAERQHRIDALVDAKRKEEAQLALEAQEKMKEKIRLEQDAISLNVIEAQSKGSDEENPYDFNDGASFGELVIFSQMV